MAIMESAVLMIAGCFSHGHGTIVGAKGSSLSKELMNLPSQFSRVTFGRKHLVLPCLKKASEISSSVSISDAVSVAKKTDSEKIEAEKIEAVQKGVFPSGLENMLKDICNGTTIAEVQLKVGHFQMYMKREVESAPVEIAPLVITERNVTPQQEIKATHYNNNNNNNNSSSEEQNPFENFSDTEKELASSMQEHESNLFDIVASPTVGVFFRSKNEKGKRLPSVCKEGMIIKEGQIIGFINQFNNDVPIRANVAGKVIRFLCKNGVISAVREACQICT